MFQGDPLDRARRLVQMGAVDEADLLVRRVLVVKPSSPPGLNLMGQIAIRRDARTDAIQHFTRASLTGNNDDPRPMLNIARAQQLGGRTQDAIATARSALRRFPDDVRPRGLMALLLIEAGDVPDAVECLRTGDEARLDGPTAYKIGVRLRALPAFRQLATALLFRVLAGPGPHQEPALRALLAPEPSCGPHAYDTSRRVLALAPASVEAIDRIALMLGQRGRLVRQAAWTWQSSCLRPADRPRLERAAEQTWRVKWPAHAIAANRRLLRDRPGEFDLIDRLCQLFALSKDQASAVAWGREVLQADGHNPSVWNAIVCMYKDIGAHDDASALWRATLKRFPDKRELYYNCSVFLDEQGRYDEAVRCLHRALALSPGYTKANNQLGMTEHNLHRGHQAIRYARLSTIVAPDYPNALLNLAMYTRFTGGMGRALALLGETERLAVSVGNGSMQAAARYNAGMTRLAIGELEQGFKQLEARWATKDFPSTKRNFRQPIWPGPAAPRDSHLLLYLEQGLGDEIMMTWYIPLVRRDVGRLLVDCDERLIEILSRTYEDVEFVPKSMKGHPSTHDPRLHYKVPSFHVPQYYVPEVKALIRDNWRWAQIQGGRFPARFTVAPHRLDRWRLWLDSQFPGRPKIGLCWRSGLRSRDRDRHYLTVDEAAATIPAGAVVVNVQYSSTEEETGQLEELGRRHGFEFVTPDGIDLKNDLEEVMAILQNVDATVSAMTAVAWMSAAVGCPTYAFVTTPDPVFWPQLGTPFMPWAPSFRVFRHAPAEPWTGTIADIRSAVSHHLAAR